MKKAFIIIFFPLIVLPVSAQSWVNKPITDISTQELQIATMSVCDSVSVAVSGSKSRIYLSTDSGNQWIVKDYRTAASDSTDMAMDISATDKNHLWIGTWNGRILNTTDGGTNWILQFYDTTLTKFINYIKMFDSNNGVAMGDANTLSGPAIILKTNNGGQSWISVNTQAFGVDADLWRRVNFPNPNVGYFFESFVNPQKLYKTTDGGAHWDTTNFSQVSSYLTIIKFYNESIGIADNFGKICYTIDGGQNWDTTIISDKSWGMDLEFVKNNNDLIVALAKSDGIYFSADTGKTWTTDTTLKGKDVRNLSFFDKNRGWAFAQNGGPYYNNVNVTSLDDNKITIPVDFLLSQNYPNPFNPSTIIKFDIKEPGLVSLKIYDVLGREVRTLLNEEKSAGSYKINFDAKDLPSGIYFYRIAIHSGRLSSGNFTSVKKMILLR